MKNIYLHIGLPRCASTLIETEFVYPGRLPYEAMKRSGVKPLMRLYKELRRGLSRPRWNDVFCNRLRDYHLTPVLKGEGEGQDVRGYFVTDEGLTHISDIAGEPSIFEDRAQFCGKLFDGFQTTVLMMVRNQVSYVESLYGLHVQNSGTKEFDDYYAAFPIDAFDWLPVADAYAQVFGEDNIKVFPLERQAYAAEEQPLDDFVHGLLNAMGVDEKISGADLSVFNPSLDARLLPAQVEINRTFPPEIAREVQKILSIKAPKERGAAQNLLTHDQAQAIREKFAASNRELFARFMPRFSPVGYLQD